MSEDALRAALAALPEHVRAAGPAPDAPLEHVQLFLQGVRAGTLGAPAPRPPSPSPPRGAPGLLTEREIEAMSLAERTARRDEILRAARENRLVRKTS